MTAVWTLGAEADVQRLYEQQERREEESGELFYKEVLSSIQLLEVFPEIGPVVYRDEIRRVLVYKRHFGLFYVVEPRGIILHALLDLRQDPQSIMRRLRGI